MHAHTALVVDTDMATNTGPRAQFYGRASCRVSPSSSSLSPHRIRPNFTGPFLLSVFVKNGYSFRPNFGRDLHRSRPETVSDTPFAWWSRARVPAVALNGEPVTKTSGPALVIKGENGWQTGNRDNGQKIGNPEGIRFKSVETDTKTDR